MKDKGIGQRIVPVIPDEARTFGIDAMFPSAKIYSPHGQRYEAVDRELLLSYKEAVQGQILHEGITEAGSMASVIAAGTSYATHGEPMIPVYVFYSMFGFQRTGDQMWQLGDQLGRGFLLGATAGRTTLNGEGLQHQDGHSLLLASTNPAVVAYDPAFAYEVAMITEDGLRRMYGDAPEDVFYYLTVYNEPFPQPPGAAGGGAQGGRARGHVPLRAGRRRRAARAGPRQRHLGAARARGAAAAAPTTGAWRPTSGASTSWNELRRDAVACEEHALLHPEEARTPYVARALEGGAGPGDRGQRLDALRPRPDQPLGARRSTSRSAPTASAAPTPARRCAGTSAPTRSRSRPPSSRSWRTAASCRRTPRPRRVRALPAARRAGRRPGKDTEAGMSEVRAGPAGGSRCGGGDHHLDERCSPLCRCPRPSTSSAASSSPGRAAAGQTSRPRLRRPLCTSARVPARHPRGTRRRPRSPGRVAG